MAMVKSAVKRNRRKSQREAARLQRLADAVPVMEEGRGDPVQTAGVWPEYSSGVATQYARSGGAERLHGSPTDGQDSPGSVDGPGLGQH